MKTSHSPNFLSSFAAQNLKSLLSLHVSTFTHCIIERKLGVHCIFDRKLGVHCIIERKLGVHCICREKARGTLYFETTILTRYVIKTLHVYLHICVLYAVERGSTCSQYSKPSWKSHGVIELL